LPETRFQQQRIAILGVTATTSTRLPSRVIGRKGFGGAEHRRPKIVWDFLKMPEAPTRSASNATQAICEKIVTQMPTPMKFGFGPPVEI